MALAKFVVTAKVTFSPDTQATLVAGEPGTGGASGFGSYQTVAPGTTTKYGWLPQFVLPGQIVWADSAAGSNGPQLLYQAIGAANLRAFVDGQDTVGHAAISN